MAAAGLAGSQVIGTPKNRALCERANAGFENVCWCHSGDSPPRGSHRDPRPLCHGRAPLAFEPGLKACGGPPRTRQIWVGNRPPLPARLSLPRSSPREPILLSPCSWGRLGGSSWCPRVCQLKASASHSVHRTGSRHCPIPAWVPWLARWVHCPVPGEAWPGLRVLLRTFWVPSAWHEAAP